MVAARPYAAICITLGSSLSDFDLSVYGSNELGLFAGADALGAEGAHLTAEAAL